MFLQEARLGGVRGSADLRWRRRTLSNRDWRGTFVFEPEDESSVTTPDGTTATAPTTAGEGG